MAFLKPPLYSVLYSRFFFWLHPGLMHKSYVAITVAGGGKHFENVMAIIQLFRKSRCTKLISYQLPILLTRHPLLTEILRDPSFPSLGSFPPETTSQ